MVASGCSGDLKALAGLTGTHPLALNLPPTSPRWQAAQPSGGNALAIVRFFEGELAIVQIGDHGVALLALCQFAAQAAWVFRVWPQVQGPWCFACHLNDPLTDRKSTRLNSSH